MVQMKRKTYKKLTKSKEKKKLKRLFLSVTTASFLLMVQEWILAYQILLLQTLVKQKKERVRYRKRVKLSNSQAKNFGTVWWYPQDK